MTINSSRIHPSGFWRLAAQCVLVISATMSVDALAARIAVSVVDPAGKPVPNAGVYATLKGAPPPSPARREIAIEQINKEFVPLVSIAQTGTAVNFPNRDAIRHHVYSFSPAKTFEIKLYSGVPAKPEVFDKPGEVTLGCNIHDNMIAFVLVVDTPYFAKTDARGRAVLDNLPAGEYDLTLWYPGGEPVPAPQKHRLAAADALDASFTFRGKQLAVKPGVATGMSK
jgi:plastocyanin